MIKVVNNKDAYRPLSSTVESNCSSTSTYSGVDMGSLTVEETSVLFTDENQDIDMFSMGQIQTSTSEGSTKVCNKLKL